ncbi:MAG TPA: thiamine-phosphate kinase [Candidatus Cybelea sp.]|nr:thiamine-phosphate kinase [Candidatus Cybelea sp.]
MARAGEFEVIARYFAPLAKDYPLAFGLSDDAALIRPPPGHEIVVTTDCMIAGHHFFADDPPQRIAQKLLRVNLSDLAAMGATPIGYMLASAWRDDTTEAWIAAFADGLKRDQATYGVSLIGGDTVLTDGPLTFTVTAFGYIADGKALRRNGARVGDSVFVSGSIGDAELGLRCRMGEIVGLAPGIVRYLLDRHQLPEPRVSLGRKLVGIASAAIDVSDGLVADLGHICAASGVDAVIRLADVPRSPAAASVLAVTEDTLSAVAGGDDYELCFTAPAHDAVLVTAAANAAGVPVQRIGEVIGQGPGHVQVLDLGGRPIHLERQGFTHF